jgi:copper homeostasis protein
MDRRGFNPSLPLLTQPVNYQRSTMLLEACVENLSEALIAEKRGAGRIELCDNLAAGGTTPSYGTIVTCKKHLSIPVIVMIRPRGGNFVYSLPEVECMLEDIRICKMAGADGIATGVLTPGGEIDLPLLRRLINEAGPLQITFHKAIDETNDIRSEIQKLTGTGVNRVLTSGGAPTALEGSQMLKELITLTSGSPVILTAGKVTADNLDALSKLIPSSEFHGRKIVGDLK